MFSLLLCAENYVFSVVFILTECIITWKMTFKQHRLAFTNAPDFTRTPKILWQYDIGQNLSCGHRTSSVTCFYFCRRKRMTRTHLGRHASSLKTPENWIFCRCHCWSSLKQSRLLRHILKKSPGMIGTAGTLSTSVVSPGSWHSFVRSGPDKAVSGI